MDNLNENFLENCKKGDLEKVKLLLSQGADIETKGVHGNTPLISASRNGCLEIVKHLLSQGAEIEAKDYYGDTALILAP